MAGLLNPLDLDALRESFSAARPFPFVLIEQLLDPEFALEVAECYPTFQAIAEQGFHFNRVNEQKKAQITNPELFPEPVRRLNDALAAPEFLRDIEYITKTPKLLADESLVGGGMHVSGSSGRLDVHVDFNYVADRQLHRRLNLLLYLNPEWRDEWGGAVELWDRRVKLCHHSIKPLLNRCVLFATSEISFHGVEVVACPSGSVRRSFAAYYYTKEPPPEWDGRRHSTVFVARPDERLRRYLLMPAERLQRNLSGSLRSAKKVLKTWLP